MKKAPHTTIKLSAGLAALALAAPGAISSAAAATETPSFSNPSRVTNPFLPISKYPHCTLVGVGEDKGTRVVRRVLDRTEPFTIDGTVVQAMVVRDSESDNGDPVERTLDYFAQDDAGTVYYLGEDVDTYKHGQVVGHEGQWRYGRDTQVLTPVMPAHPEVGDTWMSEDVPGITQEADRAVKAPKRATIHGVTYKHLLRVRESALPDKEIEFKLYAKGLGVVSEENGLLELKGC